MGTPRVTRAVELAVQLGGAGITATHNPGEVLANAPCVLVAPPRLLFDTFEGATATWRLLAIASTPADQLQAWQQLDALVDQLAQLLNVETAEPTAWALTPGADSLPAYAVTFTETVE